MLAMIMGSGKTRLAIELVGDLDVRLVLIVCPRRVIDVWRAQFSQYSTGEWQFAALDSRVGSVRDKMALARDMYSWARERNQRLVVCINYESARIEPFASWALRVPWPVVVSDECVPPGSLVSTPNGNIPIENLREGDTILGYDHATNKIVETRVSTTFARQTASPLIQIGKARLTPAHPVWTVNRGYVQAGALKATDTILEFYGNQQENPSHDLRILRTAGQSGKSHPVYNIETRTGNYFVDDVLVHNCHRIKDAAGRTSRFMSKLGARAHFRLGLTGTPMPHMPLDIWGQFRFLDPRILDPTYGSFKIRHAVMGGYFNKEIVAWRDLDQLYEKFRSIAFQVDASVLDLPPAIDETIQADFTPEGERAYREMENEMITWIRTMDEGRVPVTAANAMVRLMRLQQITGGSLPDEQLQPVIVDTAKERLLEDFLADVGREPVVVFAVYKADLAAIRRAARMNSLLSGEVSGAQDDLKAWQRGGKEDPTVLAVQMQSGAEGIDMTRARLAVYYSHGFSLALYQQSRARILRPPQKQPVAFYHLQIRYSIDAHILRAVLARQDLVEGVLKGLRKS